LLWLALVVVLAFYPVRYVSTFCALAGHAWMARLAGWSVASFGLGVGRPVLTWSWGATRVYLGLTRSFLGRCFALSPEPVRTRRRVAPHVGGVATHVALAVTALGLLLYLSWGGVVWGVALAFNGAAAAGKLLLLPASLRRSRGRKTISPGPAIIESLTALRGLWYEIGDRVTLFHHLVEAAAAWQELRDAEQGEHLIQEAEVLARERGPGVWMPVWPFLQAKAVLVRGIIDAKAGRFMSAATTLDTAEAAFAELGHEPGKFQVACARAEMLRDQGDAAGAIERLDTLAAQIPVSVSPTVKGWLLAARLWARTSLSRGEGVEDVRAEYEARRSDQPAVRDLQVYPALARLYARLGDYAQAESAYREAIGAARKIHTLFASVEEQKRFDRAQACLLTEAGDCLRRLGKDEDAHRLQGLSLPPEELAHQKLAARQQRGRLHRRLGLALVLLNVVVVIAVVCLLLVINARATTPVMVMVEPQLDLRMPMRQPQTLRDYALMLPFIASARLGKGTGFLLILLAACTALALVYALLLFLAGRLKPSLKGRGNAVLLLLAMSPWIGWGSVFLLYLLYTAAVGKGS
jgi:tetratricopeptide (TPR) repeat protein